MKNLLKKIFLCLAGGSLSFIIAACYGMPERYDRYTSRSTVTAKNDKNEPIPGLKLSIHEGSNRLFETATNQNGEATFSLEQSIQGPSRSFTIEAEDIDGPLNLGEFEKSSEPFSFDREHKIIMFPKKPSGK